MVSKLEMEAHFTCGEVDKQGRFVILGTKKGTIRIIDVTDIHKPRLILIKKINLEKQVYKIQISHDGTMVAILNKTARRVIFLSTDPEEEFNFIGFVKLPGECLDIAWASCVRPPINSAQNNKALECIIKNGLLVAIVPPPANKINLSRQLEDISQEDVSVFGRRIDFDIERLTVKPSTGEVFCCGKDRLLKKYSQPEEYLPKMDMRVKAPKNPEEEIVSHDLDTTYMTCYAGANNSSDWLVTGGSEGSVIKRNSENLADFVAYKAQNYKSNGINCLYASTKYP